MLVKPGTATATEQNSYKFMETNSEVKEGDPVSALTEGKPLTWAPLVGTNSMSSCVASITTHTMFDTRPRAVSPVSSATLKMENTKKKKASSSKSFTTTPCGEGWRESQLLAA